MADEVDPTVGDVYERVIPKIIALRHEFDLDRLRHPEIYGPAPRSVWRRLAKYRRDHAHGDHQ